MSEFFCKICAKDVDKDGSLLVGTSGIRDCIVCSSPVDTDKEEYHFFRDGTLEKMRKKYWFVTREPIHATPMEDIEWYTNGKGGSGLGCDPGSSGYHVTFNSGPQDGTFAVWMPKAVFEKTFKNLKKVGKDESR